MNEDKPTITYADFAKLDMRIGTIEAVEEVEGSNKLLKILVDLGDLGKRTILSGIKNHPEILKGMNLSGDGVDKVQPFQQLIGTQVLVLANLEPKKMMGLESQGMILMAVEKVGKTEGQEEQEGPYFIASDATSQGKQEGQEKITLLVPQENVPEGTRIE